MILWGYGRNGRSLHFSVLEFQPHEISKITEQLCIAIGRGHISVPKDSRFSLLSTWMEAHFSWMTRSCRSVDKKLVEDGQFSPFHCLSNRVFCLLGLTVYISNFILWSSNLLGHEYMILSRLSGFEGCVIWNNGRALRKMCGITLFAEQRLIASSNRRAFD